MKEIPKMLTPDEVCAMLRIKKSHLYRLVERGDVPSVKVGRLLRFDPDALYALIREVRRPVSDHEVSDDGNALERKVDRRLQTAGRNQGAKGLPGADPARSPAVRAGSPRRDARERLIDLDAVRAKKGG